MFTDYYDTPFSAEKPKGSDKSNLCGGLAL